MTIDAEIDALIAREGGFVDHPADRGGPTKFGITEQRARACGYRGEMRDLARETAAAIYRQLYWSEPRFDAVALRYPRLAAELFDMGVNMGPAIAGKALQRALNVLNRGAADYPDIVADGRIGAMTIAALDGYRARRGSAGELVLVSAVDGLRVERYIAIAEANPTQEVFEYGWLSRVGAGAGA